MTRAAHADSVATTVAPDDTTAWIDWIVAPATPTPVRPYAYRFDDSFMRPGPLEHTIGVVVILALLFVLLVGVRRKQ